MLEGYITFRWSDGYEQHVPFLHNLKGIQHERSRPTAYKISITTGSVSELEAAILNEWFYQVPAVLLLR